MVRVVSQNFSPPRSRHSSGETDRDLAERANLALSALGRKRVDAPEYESSSDSFWDSEFDGDQCEALASEKDSANDDINGNESPEKSDVQSKRKERRRERNKVSAQAYRQRRRTQNVKEQQTLIELEAENKRLHKLVETLEKKTEHAKHVLRGCSHQMLEVLQPIGELDGVTGEMSDTDADLTSPHAAASTSSHLYATCSSRGPMKLPHQSNSSPKMPPLNFVNNLSHTSVKSEHPKIPIFAKSKAPNLTYHTSTQPSPTVCPPLSHSQLFFNTNVFIGATLIPPSVANLTAVPAILSVPVESQNLCYPNSNLNCNPLRTSLPSAPFPTSNAPAYPEQQTSHTKLAGESPSVYNAVWWSGNKMEPRGLPVAGTIVGLVSMEMCNNGVNSNSVNDANGNTSSDKNISMQSRPNSQPVSFNLNLNQATVATTGQEVLCQEHLQAKHPVMSVQCFLAPGDQVPVQ